MNGVTRPAGGPARAEAGPGGPVPHYRAEHAAVAATLPGASLPWLQDLRGDGLLEFARLGFPQPRDERWKYTRIGTLEKRALHVPAEQCVGLDAEDMEAYLFAGLECHRLVFVNGQYTPQLSRPGTLPAGAYVGNLARAIAERPGDLEPHLGRVAAADAHGFAALNTAFIADGLCIMLPRGVRLERPVHCLFLNTRQEADLLVQPRNLLVLGESSEAVVLESHASLGDTDALTNAVSEVVLGADAGLEHYLLQEQGTKSSYVATLQVQQQRDSRYTSHAAFFGAQLARQDINAVLAAPGARCNLNGLYLVDGRQHVDFHTTVEHAQPHGTSREYFKGILGGRARGVFNGRVHVHPDAQRTDSEQSNKNLLLSGDAEVDTKPELEIYADDVKCSHGATVGQLDPDMLFYLRARGIDEAMARGMLTYGFAQDLVDRMSLEPVRERMERILLTRVPDAEHVRAIL